MSSNGILVSYSQVIRLVEVNEDPLRWDLKMNWDTPPTRVSTGSHLLIDNTKISWDLDMQLRGVNINCELMREAQFYSQLHGEPQWELSSQVSLSAKRDLTRQLKSTRWSRRCNETKMTIVEMPCNTNWFGTPYLIVSRSLSTEIHVLGMAKKKMYAVAPISQYLSFFLCSKTPQTGHKERGRSRYERMLPPFSPFIFLFAALPLQQPAWY